MSESDGMTPREELQALVPWYVAGTLDDQDRARLENAMREDPALARSIEAARHEQAGSQLLNEMLPGPSPAMGQRVFDAIGQAPARRDWLAAIGSWVVANLSLQSPRLVGATVAAAIALMVVQGLSIGGLVWRGASSGAGFTTASDPGIQPPAHFIVRFAPDAPASRIQDTLARLGLTFAGGPTADGFYRLRAPQNSDPATLARIFGDVQSQRDIFALVLRAPSS